MASCSIGASNIKILNSHFGRVKAGKVQPQGNLNTWTKQRPQQFAGLVLSERSRKALVVSCGPSSEPKTALKLGNNAIKLGKSSGDTKSSLRSPLTPNSYEVESLLTTICDTTSIAEFELKLGGFHLHVTRDLTGIVTTPPPPRPPPTVVPASAPVSSDTSSQTPASKNNVSTSLSVSESGFSSRSIQTLLDKAADEGLAILKSPRVGYFRRSRTIKGKRAPPSCKENQIVKEGQVICFIEQLGGELPIESDVSGEVIRILREDGDPVGYGEALMAILPSFPGIKKLQ